MENKQHKNFLKRFQVYQRERFPFIAHGILIASFTFSAISYSRICRGVEGFIDLKHYFVGVTVTVTLFFLVRILDEFKDKEDDAKYRKYLPVPRGLISFKELRIMAIVVLVVQVVLISMFQPNMLPVFLVVLLYLLLMTVEFFVPKYLKAHQILYITSHMVIIPLIDIYASALDWLIDGTHMHWGLAFFFAVSYMNGLVLEFGRKIRAPENEEVGVVSYTSLYGTLGGCLRWLILLLLTLLCAISASEYVGYGKSSLIILGSIFTVCALPGLLFLARQTEKLSKYIEYSSALWTLSMYFTLGAIPMINSFL